MSVYDVSVTTLSYQLYFKQSATHLAKPLETREENHWSKQGHGTGMRPSSSMSRPLAHVDKIRLEYKYIVL